MANKRPKPEEIVTKLHWEVLWCPGAESNHRHEDFQSTALPLSYPGTGGGMTAGWRRSKGSLQCCPELPDGKTNGLVGARRHGASVLF